MSLTAVLSPPATRAIDTHFGRFEFQDAHVLSFPDGIPGFEACRRFLLIASTDLEPLSCLQAIDPPQPSFLVLDPEHVCPRYTRTLSSAEYTRLEAGPEACLLWLVIVTATASSAFANLKAPIVINPQRQIGYQIVSARTSYPVKWPVSRG